jgi:uncharacterized protein YccT (UPF0319 family)
MIFLMLVHVYANVVGEMNAIEMLVLTMKRFSDTVFSDCQAASDLPVPQISAATATYYPSSRSDKTVVGSPDRQPAAM